MAHTTFYRKVCDEDVVLKAILDIEMKTVTTGWIYKNLY